MSKMDIKRGLTLPRKPSKELAEFIGILAGDGYLNLYAKYFSMLEIAGDKNLDREYHTNYVSNLINALFNIVPTVYLRKDQNTRYLRLLSKGLISYLISIGFKKGRKGNIPVPNWILDNDVYQLYFIKGLADTDFSLMLMNKPSKKNKYYPIVSFTNKSNNLINQVSKYLNKEGFNVNVSYNDIKKDKRGYNYTVSSRLTLSGRNNLSLWMIKVGFRNIRHLVKYDKYKNGDAGTFKS